MPRLRLALPALALLACAAAFAACGGSSSGNAASTTASGNGAASLDAFRSCLEDQGVQLPSPQQGGGYGDGRPPTGTTARPPAGAGDDKLQKAMQACAKYQPRGGAGPRGGGQASAAFTTYLTCLKDQGLTVDPSAGLQALQSLDRTTASAKKALAACASKLPQRGGTTPPAQQS